MANGTFKGNDAGIKQFLRGAELRQICKTIAEKGKTEAIAMSSDFVVTGDYISSFEVTTEEIEWTGKYPGPRSSAQLTNTSGHAAAVEWGNKHDDHPHRVLGRVLDRLRHD